MPAVTVADVLALPRIVTPAIGSARPVLGIVQAVRALEGAGFEVWRGFAGLDLRAIDPFVLLDQLGPTYNEPGAAKGAPWHPHRGFETVTYIIDGEIAHHDSHGGGGLIADGDTQWMTAGSGILHDEVPSERVLRTGGVTHGIQLWVNLPQRLKFIEPAYQPIVGRDLTLLASPDGGAFVRLVAGRIGDAEGPGSTHSPITLAHATIEPGAQLVVPWDPRYCAMAYALSGSGRAGDEGQPFGAHQLAYFGDGDSVSVRADDTMRDGTDAFDVLLLGGLPIREPIVHYGPFVMNTKQEIIDAIDDFNAGRMGTIPT